MESFDDDLLERAAGVSREPVDFHQSVERLNAGQVGFMHVDSGIAKKTIRRDVVFVAVAVEHGIDGDRDTPAFNDVD